MTDRPGSSELAAALERQTPLVAPRPSTPDAKSRRERKLDAAAEPSGFREPIRPRARAPVPRDNPRRRRFLSELGRRGVRACSPTDVPGRVYAGVQTIISGRGDWSAPVDRDVDDERGMGQRAAWALAELPREYAHRLRGAATGTAAGERKRDLSHIVARVTVAIGWAYWQLAVRTRRHGFNRVVVGLPRGVVASLCRNPITGKRYAVSTLFATSYGKGRKGADDCGAVVKLRRARAVYAEQPPADAMPARLVGPSGFAYGLTWISERAAAPVDDAPT